MLLNGARAILRVALAEEEAAGRILLDVDREVGCDNGGAERASIFDDSAPTLEKGRLNDGAGATDEHHLVDSWDQAEDLKLRFQAEPSDLLLERGKMVGMTPVPGVTGTNHVDLDALARKHMNGLDQSGMIFMDRPQIAVHEIDRRHAILRLGRSRVITPGWLGNRRKGHDVGTSGHRAIALAGMSQRVIAAEHDVAGRVAQKSGEAVMAAFSLERVE